MTSLSLLNSFFTLLSGLYISLTFFPPNCSFLLDLLSWFLFSWLTSEWWCVSGLRPLGPHWWVCVFILSVISCYILAFMLVTFKFISASSICLLFTYLYPFIWPLSLWLSNRHLKCHASQSDLSSKPFLAPEVPILVNDHSILLFA